jgi:carbonic anhydrase/acetyltransferase-like protein (isoleucine patch superfamily)
MLIAAINGAHRLRRYAWSRVLRYGGGFRSCGRASFDPGVRIDNPSHMTIGDGVLVLRGTWLYCITDAAPEPPDLVIGAGTYIGFNGHITCARRVHLGRDCLLGNGVYVSDNQHGYRDVGAAPLRQPLSVGAVEIGEGTWLGENAAVIGRVRLGRHCVVGANAVVRDGEFPDHCVIVGAPGRVVKRYDEASRTWRRTDAEGRFVGEAASAKA